MPLIECTYKDNTQISRVGCLAETDFITMSSSYSSNLIQP